MNCFCVRQLIPFAILTLTIPAFAQDTPDAPVAEAHKGTPVLDGKIDEVWKTAPAVDVNKPVSVLLTIDEADMATAKVHFLWDDDHLYALWNVKDSKLSAIAENEPWETDSVELFLDQNKKASMFYQSDDAQYRVNYKGVLSGQGEGYNEEHVKAATSMTDDGYIVEMSVKIDKVKLAAGMKVGVELQVNDDHGSETREAVAKWNHTEDDSWEDTSNFGTLELK